MKNFIKAIITAVVSMLACWLMSLAEIDDFGEAMIIWIAVLTLLNYAMESISKIVKSLIEAKKLNDELTRKWLEEQH